MRRNQVLAADPVAGRSPSGPSSASAVTTMLASTTITGRRGRADRGRGVGERHVTTGTAPRRSSTSSSVGLEASAVSRSRRCDQAERRRADVDEHAAVARRVAGEAHLTTVEDEAEAEPPRSSGATSPFRSSSAFTGSVSVVSFSRRARRPTCVSTGNPGRSNATERTTLPVLRPTPGSVTRSSRSVGTSPSNSLVERARHADDVLRLRAEEAGRVDDLLDSLGIGVREVASRSGTRRTARA